ncbi:MAG: hypothetical protein EZS28_038487, partial [Streblomastix strix]
DAQNAGYNTASLPIKKYFNLTQRDVLAVCHVFSIVLHFANEGNGNWVKTLDLALPKRIRAGIKPEYADQLIQQKDIDENAEVKKDEEQKEDFSDSQSENDEQSTK